MCVLVKDIGPPLRLTSLRWGPFAPRRMSPWGKEESPEGVGVCLEFRIDVGVKEDSPGPDPGLG